MRDFQIANLFSGGLVLINAALAFFTWRLFRQAVFANINASNQFEMENRPLVGIDGVKSDPSEITVGGEVVKARIFFTNYGRTACRITRVRNHIMYSENPNLNAHPPFAREGIMSNIFPPGKGGEAHNIQLEITSHQKRNIESKRAFIYVFSEILYTNFFNAGNYRTSWAFKCVFQGGSLVILLFQSQYNDAT